jgi:hypothetical protein
MFSKRLLKGRNLELQIIVLKQVECRLDLLIRKNLYVHFGEVLDLEVVYLVEVFGKLSHQITDLTTMMMLQRL